MPLTVAPPAGRRQPRHGGLTVGVVQGVVALVRSRLPHLQAFQRLCRVPLPHLLEPLLYSLLLLGGPDDDDATDGRLLAQSPARNGRVAKVGMNPRAQDRDLQHGGVPWRRP